MNLSFFEQLLNTIWSSLYSNSALGNSSCFTRY